MKSILKLCASILILILFIWLICIKYLDYITVQSITLAVSAVVLLFIKGIRGFWQETRMVLPLVLILGIGYLAFATLGITPYGNVAYQGSIFGYWLHFGITRVILLVSTIYLIRILMSIFTIQDVLLLPFPLRYMKVVILGNILYNIALEQSGELNVLIAAIPSNQHRVKSIKERVWQQITFILALLFLIIRDSQVRGELIDNRILHCKHGGKR